MVGLLARGAPRVESSWLPRIDVHGDPAPAPTPASARFLPKEKEIPLGQTLETRAGVNRQAVSVGEGQEPQFVVRGLAPHQQRFFLEGVSLTDSAFDQSQLSWIPYESVSGVDYFPEAVPARLGADGLGSAFLFRWRAFQSCETDVGLKGGSLGYLRAGGQACWDQQNKIATRFAYSRSDEDFLYREDHGLPLLPQSHTWERRTDNGFTDMQFAPSFAIADGKLKGIWLTRWLEKKVPGPVSAPRVGQLREQSHALMLFWKPRASVAATLSGRFSDTQLTLANPVFVSPVPGRTEVGGAALRVNGQHAISPQVTAEWTGGVAGEVLQSRDARLGNLSAQRWEVPLAVGLPIHAMPLSFTPELQAHAFGYAGQGASFPAAAKFSPRAALEMRWGPHWTTRLTGGQFYRLPNLTERFGSANGLSPNPDLVPETAWKVALANEVTMARGVRAGLDSGYLRANDLVTYETTSPQSQTARNLGRADIWFHEAALEIDLPLSFTLRAGAEWMAATNLEAGVNFGKRIPFRPEWRLRPSLSYDTDRWSVGYVAEYSGPQYWDISNLKRSEGFWQHHIRATYRHPSWGTFSLEVANLTDLSEVPTQMGGFTNTEFSTGYRGFPAPGRRGYLSWSYVF